MQHLTDAAGGSALREAGLLALPVYDTVPAGLFKDANLVLDTDDVPQLVVSAAEANHDPRAFGLVVQGDSMVEAGILDGDVLIVSPASRVQSGDIAVVLVNQTASTVKKVYIENGRLILQPANHRYRPEVLGYPEEAEILGKVVQVRRRID
jgi:repressor LexA